MRARVLGLVLALAALGGCQSTPAAPGPNTPHETLRFRPLLYDPTRFPWQEPATSSNKPATDQAWAAQVRQSQRVATDPDARQAAFGMLDCAKPDPLKGKDQADLPLATCSFARQDVVLGPSAMDGSQVASAGYRHMTTPWDTWVVTVDLTPAGAKTWADYTASHGGEGALDMVLDGQDLGGPSTVQDADGRIELRTDHTEQQARDLAAVINNH